MRRHRRRFGIAGAVAAFAVITLTACGSDGSTTEVASVTGGQAAPAASATAGTDPDQARKFSACMRENGVPEFPDPGADGQIDFDQMRGLDIDQQKLESAREACRDLAPNGGERPAMDAAQQEQLRQFAQCMRDHGVDMADPDPNSGGFGMGGAGATFDRDDPTFVAAMEACQDKLTFLQGADS